MNNCVYIGSLSYDTDERGLRDAFGEHGELTDAEVVVDRDTGTSRGFGFVTFAEESAARFAIEVMNGSELDGRRLIVYGAMGHAYDRRRGRS